MLSPSFCAVELMSKIQTVQFNREQTKVIILKTPDCKL